MSHSSVLCQRMCAAAAVSLLLAFAGCQSVDPRSNSTDAAVPRMPIVNLPARPPRVPATFEEIMQAAAKKDVGGMVAASSRIDDPMERVRITTQVAAAVAPRDVALATQFATALAGGRARDDSIAAVAHVVAQRRDPDPLAWVLQFSDPAARLVAQRVVIEDLSRTNPLATVERVRGLPANREREDMLAVAVAAWARQDANAALAWVRALPDGEQKQRLTSTAAFLVAETRPDQAVALAETIAVGRDRWLLFSMIGQTWVARDPKAAMAWARRLPAGESREAAFAGIESGLGVPTTRGIAAVPAASDSGRTGFGRSPAVAWPEMNSPDFAAWLATQRPGMSRDEAILEYVRQRGALQPWAVGPWLASLPGDVARDQAMEIFVDGLLIGSPAEAARWVSELPRSARWDELMERAARRWLLANPDAAEIWLRTAPLAPDRKGQLLREVGR